MSTRVRDFTITKTVTPAQRELERQALQQMASRVLSEAHWQTILTSADGPQREELERVVGPLLAFRRAAVCTTPDCGSGEAGIWQPVLQVRSPLDVGEFAWVPIELRLCPSCKEEAQLDDFLTDAIWGQIMGAWADSTIPPVRRLTTLAWDRIH